MSEEKKYACSYGCGDEEGGCHPALPEHKGCGGHHCGDEVCQTRGGWKKSELDRWTIGALWLTTGGRIVKPGAGENASEQGGDILIMTAVELQNGIVLSEFQRRLKEAIKQRNKPRCFCGGNSISLDCPVPTHAKAAAKAFASLGEDAQ